MKDNEKIIFDELDKKCIEELPIIIEVLASTFNKIARLFSIYFKEIEEIAIKELKGKKEWKLKKENYFCPFTYEEKKYITHLYNYFQFKNDLQCKQIINGIEKNIFHLEIGYWYKNVEEEQSHQFHFGIYRYDWEIKHYGGAMFDVQFYEKLKNNLKDYSITFLHPNENDGEEWFQIECKDLDLNKLNKAFEIYKSQILKPYLNNPK